MLTDQLFQLSLAFPLMNATLYNSESRLESTHASGRLFTCTRKEAGTMSDLFNAGPARHTRDGFTVSHSGAGDIVKKLQKLRDGGEVAIKRTVSDFATRGPGWVSKGIREHYGVDAAAIKEAAKRPSRGHTSIRVAGISVDGATLEYKGRTLTPLHFKMSPKQAPTTKQKNPIRIPGQLIAAGSPVAMVRPPKPYTVKATIIKGQRSAMSSDTFLTAGRGGVVLPYQKSGDDRKPIEAVRTLSVPQMIDGRARETIEQTINTKLGERFNHHIERAMR